MKGWGIVYALGLPSLACAEDGKQLYATHCIACHAENGTGASNVPPLAESAWLRGDADRAIKVVLHGLTGPVNISGNLYNLNMPPHGATLSDEQIAAVLTYVGSSWGNHSNPVEAALVGKIRSDSSDRKSPWAADEILRLHPLPLEKTALSNLISLTYSGVWIDLPDFSGLPLDGTEEEHDGLLRVPDDPDRQHFGIVWEGRFEAPVSGGYTFQLDADDSARVILDGKPVVEVRGVGRMNAFRDAMKKTSLTAGSHAFRVEYAQYRNERGIALGWQGPALDGWHWLTEKQVQPRCSIPIQPRGTRPVIYRNFIAGTTPRAIGVGFPGGVNLAWSADHLGPELLWTGKFMDGGRHWTGRGAGNEPPAGVDLIELSHARAFASDARYGGYALDPAGNPTFLIEIGGQLLSDSWSARQGKLVRRLILDGGPPVEVLISEGDTNHLHLEGATLKVLNDVTSLTLESGKPTTLIYGWK